MDILHKIRDLLGANKTEKRKYSDNDDFEISSRELKKRRSITHNVMTSYAKNYGVDSTALGSYQTPKHNLENETRNSITALIEGNSQSDFKAPMTNGKRKVPDLINVRSSIKDMTYNSTLNGPQQTVKPHFDRFAQRDREQFRNIPPLYAINQSTFRANLDRTSQQNSYFDNTQKSIISSSIISNNSLAPKMKFNSNQSKNVLCNGLGSGEHFLTSNSTASNLHRSTLPISYPPPQADIGRSNYKEMLIKLIPGYKFLANTIKGNDNKTNHTELDDSSDDERSKAASPSPKNTSIVEPVNSLKARYDAIPLLRDNWETQLNDEYSSRSLSRRENVRAEEIAIETAEKKSRETELSINEKLRKISIASKYSYEIEEEEEEKVPANDYPPLDTDKQKQIVKWISGRDGATVLVSKFSLSITRSDIQTLNWSPLTWLNDEVINFFMELLGERSRQNENLPKVHAMNTFFLPRLLEHGYSGVRRWTRKVDIFSFDIIPVPVHKGIHWCMAIIHMKNKTIKYYDSMGAPNNQALTALVEYLKSESLDKKKQEFDLNGWTTENVRNIPQQENGSDCGVFSCMYAEFITRNRPIVFSQQHMQYFRMKMVYEICTGQMLN